MEWWLNSTRNNHEYAKEHSIVVDSEFSIPNQIHFENVDIAVLIGNILDNAIEGCLTIPVDRYINLNVHYSSGTLYIKVENNFDGIIQRQGDFIKSRKDDSFDHGFGLLSIQNIVEKYDGNLHIEHEYSVFRIGAMLREKTEGVNLLND